MKRSMKKLHVGITIDSVLRDFSFQFTRYAREIRGIDMDTEDYEHLGFPTVLDDEGQKVIRDVFSNPTVGEYVFHNAPPITNAYTGYRLLTANPHIGVYVISRAKKDYQHLDEKWLRENRFDEHDETFFEGNILNAPVQVLIDHQVNQVLRFNMDKRDSILMNAPHNLDMNLPASIPRVNDMIEAYRYLKQRYAKYI